MNSILDNWRTVSVTFSYFHVNNSLDKGPRAYLCPTNTKCIRIAPPSSYQLSMTRPVLLSLVDIIIVEEPPVFARTYNLHAKVSDKIPYHMLRLVSRPICIFKLFSLTQRPP